MFVKSLTAEEYNRLIQYLISKPYRESASLIAMISTGVKIPEEKKPETKPETKTNDTK